MKQKSSFFIYQSVFMLLTLHFSGCVKYHDLLPSETPQASTKDIALSFITQSIKDVKFYREFVTEAIFNVLWKSPTNGNIILDMYANRRGLSLNKKEAIINKNQRMHGNYISFFVLSYILDTQRPDLHDTDPTWTMYLETKEGHKIAPVKVRPMDMTPELATIFGKRNTNFKQLYFVKFPRKYTEGYYKKAEPEHDFVIEEADNNQDQPDTINQTPKENIIVEKIEKTHDIYDAQELKLVINSVELEEKITWPIESHLAGTLDMNELPQKNSKESEIDEDFDWI